MENLDLFYRGFLDFKKQTKQTVDVSSFYDASKTFNKPENENISVIFSTCVIKEDWVLAIEQGLPYIQKAIKEERQFIRNDSEVLPIERIRKVSKQSIEDLSKHSNYITHLPEDETSYRILPDKMLMVRKESDYTVYENRVLYATLYYLRDFIKTRLDVIKKMTYRYEAKSHLKKKVNMNNRIIDINLNLSEIRENDPLAIKKNENKELIERLDVLMAQVIMLLETPLMQEVSKVDMVRRPIVKTNVLKMNKNFKEALALFDFIVAYEEPGYLIKTIEKSFSPLTLDMVKDYSEVALLMSFITYSYGNNLEPELRKRYFEAENKRQQEKENKLIEKIKNIRKKIEQEGKTLDEYLTDIEKAIKILEDKITSLNNEIKTITSNNKKKIEAMVEEHRLNLKETKETMEAAHNLEVKNLKEGYEEEILLLKSQIENLNEEIVKITSQKEEEISSLNASYQGEIATLNQNHLNEVDNLTKDFKDQIDKANYERDLARGELIGFKIDHGFTPSTFDYTSKERFEELENIRISFEKFFDSTWEETKKKIRKDIFGRKYK